MPGQDPHHGPAAGLARPAGLRATSGQGQVTLDWDPVPGAAGYLVYRAAGEPYEPLDHGGGDVLAVPAGPYADTSGEPGRVRHYAVAAVAEGASAGPLSDSIAAAPAADGPATVTIVVGAAGAGPAGPGAAGPGAAGPGAAGSTQATGSGLLERPWEPMIGSEHLSYLLSRDLSGGRVIGPELREALRTANAGLACRPVRRQAFLAADLKWKGKAAAARCTTSA